MGAGGPYDVGKSTPNPEPAPGPYHGYNYPQLQQMLAAGNPGSLRTMANSWSAAGKELDRFGGDLRKKLRDNEGDWSGEAADMYHYKVWQLADTAEDAGWCCWRVANGLTKAAENMEWRQQNYPQPASPLYLYRDNPAPLLRMDEDQTQQAEQDAREDDRRMQQFMHHFDQELGAAAADVDACQQHKGYHGPPPVDTGERQLDPRQSGNSTGGGDGGGAAPAPGARAPAVRAVPAGPGCRWAWAAAVPVAARAASGAAG